MRYLLGLILVAALVVGGLYVYAGRMAGPAIEITSPEKYVGQKATVEVSVTAPEAKLTSLQIAFEQNGKQTPLVSLAQPGDAEIKQEGNDKIHVAKTFGRDVVPDLKSGPARILVTAERQVMYGLRKTTASATRDVTVRLEKPTVAVLSTKHYINLGGSELIVYRATPADVESGVQVGDLTYPGYPASGANIDGVHFSDPAVRVAFFALRWDQDVNTEMHLYAKDEAGNTARAEFDHLAFPKPFKKSTIPISDTFINKALPWIYDNTTEVKATGDPLQDFLQANGKLRQLNAAKIASYREETAPAILWGGAVFHPFTNSAVEAAFADQRTYVYDGKEVDRQTHLGFDLARVVNSPVVAANAGKVLHAGPLGIYGNCIILDHGMGVQSLYGHLSSIAVKAGDTVTKEQEMGRSGMTGMAGGDHLHFTMLVNGQMVNPVEWWDQHWIQDRILRKLHETGGS
jgi:murein DD-endopeptidase MepM/ murein hydrolase activator NlpD